MCELFNSSITQGGEERRGGEEERRVEERRKEGRKGKERKREVVYLYMSSLGRHYPKRTIIKLQ